VDELRLDRVSLGSLSVTEVALENEAQQHTAEANRAHIYKTARFLSQSPKVRQLNRGNR
jgi:hypothetical protein